MTDFFGCKEVFGRKQHVCEQCGRPIFIGEKHLYSAGKLDGDFSAYREHLDCHDLWITIRGLKDLNWDEESEFLINDDLSDDREWITRDHPAIAARLFPEVQA